MIKENYVIHMNLAKKTADGILEAASVSVEKDGKDSYKSEKYRPKRSRKYSVDVHNDDENSLCSESSFMIKELRDFRRRSIHLTKINANQVSDLRLLISQQMKVMLNNLVNHRVDSPSVCGILVEAKICSLYKMDLISPQFYRMVLFSSFSLCTSSPELFLIPNMFLYLNASKTIAVDAAKKVEQNELVRAKGKRLFEDPIPASWAHNSTCKFSVVKESD